MNPQNSTNWPLIVASFLVVASVVWIVGSRLIRRQVKRMTRRGTEREEEVGWEDRLSEHHFFRRMALVVPAVAVYLGAESMLGYLSVSGQFPDELGVAGVVVRRVAGALAVFAVARAFQALLDAADHIYNDRWAEARTRPIKGYLQLVALAAWIVAVVVIVAIAIGQSPVTFLTGLGALAAVLMLVFRDTILSLVASVQISSNDMIRIGDWVSVPQANCDGEVVEVALHTVKVQNWDKTISTIPTSRFITESFRNWRGMSESGGRRIKRSLSIDMNSVRFLTEKEVAELSRRELLVDYMREAVGSITRFNSAKASGEEGVEPEIRRLTNLGTFRIYVLRYLQANPRTHREMTTLVRQLDPRPEGVPIEVYCFSKNTEWAKYEALQADIFDHLIAVLPEFGLRPFQAPTGSDFRRVLAAGS